MRYDGKVKPDRDLSSASFRALADFRYQIRRFLHFSEEAAGAEGLEPQQHQMMLAIRALDDGAGPAIGALADHLFIRHHSAVGLIDRLEERRLVERARTEPDRRLVRVKLTPAGKQKLHRLSRAHRTELRNSGPRLVETLDALLQRRSGKA
jgi:DNA-binding MarR family transcriptional regulator